MRVCMRMLTAQISRKKVAFQWGGQSIISWYLQSKNMHQRWVHEDLLQASIIYNSKVPFYFEDHYCIKDMRSFLISQSTFYVGQCSLFIIKYSIFVHFLFYIYIYILINHILDSGELDSKMIKKSLALLILVSFDTCLSKCLNFEIKNKSLNFCFRQNYMMYVFVYMRLTWFVWEESGNTLSARLI